MGRERGRERGKRRGGRYGGGRDECRRKEKVEGGDIKRGG
jgi:hypothetical protein